VCVYGKAIDWEISNGQTNRNPCWLFKWQQKDHKFGRIFPSDSIFRNLWNKRYFQFDYGRKTLLDISWLLIALSLSLYVIFDDDDHLREPRFGRLVKAFNKQSYSLVASPKHIVMEQPVEYHNYKSNWESVWTESLRLLVPVK